MGTGRIGEKDIIDQCNYVRFYAYLNKVVDREIMKVLDALEASGKTKDTLIFRMSDHGEMAMAHGRQRQKMYNVYQETINVPMIFSNPILYRKPEMTDSLGSLIDVLPTLATVAGVPDRDRWVFKGKDLSPILENPKAEVQSAVHFTYADTWLNVPGANHISCITEKDWKYAVYYDVATGVEAQYEMYHLAKDPLETRNLAHEKVSITPEIEKERQRLHQKLIDVMEQTGTTPNEIIFPKVSGVDPMASFPGPKLIHIGHR